MIKAANFPVTITSPRRVSDSVSNVFHASRLPCLDRAPYHLYTYGLPMARLGLISAQLTASWKIRKRRAYHIKARDYVTDHFTDFRAYPGRTRSAAAGTW
jgi:hypothetical protein